MVKACAIRSHEYALWLDRLTARRPGWEAATGSQAPGQPEGQHQPHRSARSPCSPDRHPRMSPPAPESAIAVPGAARMEAWGPSARNAPLAPPRDGPRARRRAGRRKRLPARPGNADPRPDGAAPFWRVARVVPCGRPVGVDLALLEARIMTDMWSDLVWAALGDLKTRLMLVL